MSTVAVTEFIEAHGVDVWRLLTDLTGPRDPALHVGAGRGAHPRPVRPGHRLAGDPRPAGRRRRWPRSSSCSSRRAAARGWCSAPRAPAWTTGSPGALRPVQRRRRGCTAVTVEQEAVPTAPYGRVVALLLRRAGRPGGRGRAPAGPRPTLAAAVRSAGRATAA